MKKRPKFSRHMTYRRFFLSINTIFFLLHHTDIQSICFKVTQPGAVPVVVNPVPPTKDWMVPAVLTCLCCFWPTGIFAIMAASRVNIAQCSNSLLQYIPAANIQHLISVLVCKKWPHSSYIQEAHIWLGFFVICVSASCQIRLNFSYYPNKERFTHRVTKLGILRASILHYDQLLVIYMFVFLF